MKQVFLIRKDSEFLWSVRGKLQWGSKYSEYVLEFKSYDEACKQLDKMPLHFFMGCPYFNIEKYFKR